MNKKILILILLSISSIHTNNAMEPQSKKRKRAFSQPNSTSHIPQKNKKNYIEPSLPAILKQKIFTISSLCSTCKLLEEAAKTVNALVRVNTSLNVFINDDERTLQLIKQLSDRFGDTNMAVALMLCTKASNHRVDRQMSFFAGWDAPNFNGIEQNMNRLKRIGFDLNFTYNHQQPTVLIQAVAKHMDDAGPTQASRIAQWLVKNGADINILMLRKQNVGMLALMGTDRELMHLFLDHPDFKVNHQDNQNNTPLHCCFYDRIPRERGAMLDITRCPFMYKIVKKLLEKGANPVAMNNDGKTPLMLAQEAGYQPLIDLLEKAAISVTHASTN